MTRRARLERLAAAILARMQAQAAARMDRHGRPQTNPYMTNVAHPAILTLYTQWKRSIDAGTYAVGGPGGRSRFPKPSPVSLVWFCICARSTVGRMCKKSGC